MARGMALPEACATLSCLFLIMACRVSSSYSSLPSDAEGTLMIFPGLGLVPLPAVTLVFIGVGEDFVSDLVAEGTEELETVGNCFTMCLCSGFEAFGVAEGFGADAGATF